MKIILPGGAGLVGQNLVSALKGRDYHNIVVLDKHTANLAILKQMHPDITVEYADLAEAGSWSDHFAQADAVVMLQAQIGAATLEPFIRNNIISTEQVLAAIKQHKVPYTVHISSSVVKSVAEDDYTRTKRDQEDLVRGSGISHTMLRPTLMFGWFDRKHLGWLSRFMRRMPVFPVPGHGRYMRQPLYARDFCNIIVRCIENPMPGQAFNITGLEKIDYIDMIRQIKRATGAKAAILCIPYGLFFVLLRLWAIFDRNPPFTADQLKALVAHDEFEVIDWPKIFGVAPTPFATAVHETFNDPTYGKIVLEF